MYELLKAVLQPYFVLLVIQGLLLIWLFKCGAWHAAMRGLVVVWFLMILLSTPVVGRVLVGTLEWQYPPSGPFPTQVDAIVVMGGGLVPPDKYRPRAQVNGSSFSRCLHAADLYQRYRCPMILCGGATEDEDTPTTEAEVMAEAVGFLGVDREDLILETTSLTTRENAQRAVDAVRRRGFQNIVLVTHARHMCRASLTFRKLGLEVIPSPCGHSPRLWGPIDETLVPCVEGLGKSNWAIREWLALLYYRIRGWI